MNLNKIKNLTVHNISLTDDEIKEINFVVADRMLGLRRDSQTGEMVNEIANEEIKTLSSIIKKFSSI